MLVCITVAWFCSVFPQLAAKGVKNPNMPFHVAAAGASPVPGQHEPGVPSVKPQPPFKPGSPIISMTSALKEVGAVGTPPTFKINEETGDKSTNLGDLKNMY